jgi:hypothetical protein
MEDKAPMTMNRTFSLAPSTLRKKARPNRLKVPMMVTRARIGLWVGSAAGIKNKGVYNPVPEDISIIEFLSCLSVFTVGK